MSILALRVDHEESKLQFFLSGLQATSKKKKKNAKLYLTHSLFMSHQGCNSTGQNQLSCSTQFQLIYS